MPPKKPTIPVNVMTGDTADGISIERLSIKRKTTNSKDRAFIAEPADRAHRHDAHSFFLLEKGIVSIGIDFKKYRIKAPSIIYIHPDQVHKTVVTGDVFVSSWALTDAHIEPKYLNWLENIRPAKPLRLTPGSFAGLRSAVAMAHDLSGRKTDPLYRSFLKDSCNLLIGLLLSEYLKETKEPENASRHEQVSKRFRTLLEQHFVESKRPADYARLLNISTSYLNECIKNTTGLPVSQLIRDRVILEARRLLVHTAKSVKEIAVSLGYDDYPYFSRLFTKTVGMSALVFRGKNHD